MRRSGKSSLGELLGARLDLPFQDLDRLIEAREGLAVSRMIAERGVREFRQAETRALRSVHSGRGHVLATGGGTPMRRCNRRKLRQLGTVVFLDVSEKVLQERLTADQDRESRPLLVGGSLEEEVVLQFRARRGIYFSCAHLVVCGDGGPIEVLARLLGALGV
jgi:shikimate kinase